MNTSEYDIDDTVQVMRMQDNEGAPYRAIGGGDSDSGDCCTDLHSSNERPKTFQDILTASTVFVVGLYLCKLVQRSEDFLLGLTPPYQVLDSGDVILDLELNHPIVTSTVRSLLLNLTAIYGPLLLLIVGCLLRYSNIHHICGFLTAIGLAEGTTQILKVYVSRRRPNFYNLCEFDSELLKCTGSLHQLRNAHLGFPSGHSSVTACGMTYLCWCLATSNRLPFAAKVTLCSLLSVWALFVSASRIVDFWHFPSDAMAGLLIGCAGATLSHQMWSPKIRQSSQPLQNREASPQTSTV